ncbi:uncharacterized protein V6R79_009279 [Siganus canaliculatus]
MDRDPDQLRVRVNHSSELLPSSLLSSPLISIKPSAPPTGNASAEAPPTSSSSDLSDLEKMLLWTLHEPSTISLTVMYCLSFMLGFVGNLTSLRVLSSRRSRRLAAASATRSLLLNLAVCDLAVVCVCMPISLGSQIYRAWVYGDLLCRAVPFTQAVSVSASVLTLTVISVNRYYSVRSPLRARSMFTRRRLLATVAAVWAASSIMCAPIAVMNRRQEISFETFVLRVCQEEWPQHRLKQGYNGLLFVMLYCLPVTFNLIISFLTGRRLWGGEKLTFGELDPRSRALHVSRLKARQKIAKMVVCLVLLFAASWLPLYLADLWIDWEQRPPSWLLQTRPFAQWLGLTNSSLNPICYCFIGDLYRSAKVIRTRYHQKVAALFSSSSYASPDAMALRRAPPLSAATLLSRARGQGGGQRVADSADSRAESSHSISDWSSVSSCDRTLTPSQLHLVQTATWRSEPLPTRRHSESAKPAAPLPLRSWSLEIELLPSQRYSENRSCVLPGERRDITAVGGTWASSREVEDTSL